MLALSLCAGSQLVLLFFLMVFWCLVVSFIYPLHREFLCDRLLIWFLYSCNLEIGLLLFWLLYRVGCLSWRVVSLCLICVSSLWACGCIFSVLIIWMKKLLVSKQAQKTTKYSGPSLWGAEWVGVASAFVNCLYLGLTCCERPALYIQHRRIHLQKLIYISDIQQDNITPKNDRILSRIAIVFWIMMLKFFVNFKNGN